MLIFNYVPHSFWVRTCFTESEIRAAVEEAHLAGRRIGMHCYGGPAATWAIEAGVDIIEHGTFLTDEQLDGMVRHGTFLVSTLSVMRAAAEASHVVPFMRKRFRQVSEEYVDLIRRAKSRYFRAEIPSKILFRSSSEKTPGFFNAS